jgi:hypothetical protein
MKRNSSSSILGLFIVVIIILAIISFFMAIVKVLFPIIVLLAFVAFFWSVVKGYVNTQRPSARQDRPTQDGARPKTETTGQTKRHTGKKGVTKDAIDVEYTVIDDERSTDNQKQDKNER